MILERIKNFIEKNQNIGLLPSLGLEKDIFPATLSLFYGLKKLNKEVVLFTDRLPSKFDFLINEEIKALNADFLLSIKEIDIKFSRIFYQKIEDELRFFLKANQGEKKIDERDIYFQSLPKAKPVDLLIVLGIGQKKEISKFQIEKEIPVINIDNQLNNENYGEINLIQSNHSSFSEIVFDILKTIDENSFDSNSLNSLLAGMVQENLNFENLRINSAAFQKIAGLIERGANWQKIFSNLFSFKNYTSNRLFQRVLNKLEIIPGKNLTGVFFELKDFEETNSLPLDLLLIFEKINFLFFSSQNFFCLWELENSPVLLQGLFYSFKKELVEKIADSFKGSQKGNVVLFKTIDSDSQKIKNQLISLL